MPWFVSPRTIFETVLVVGSRESGVGSWESGVGSWQLAVGSGRWPVGSRESGVGSRELAINWILRIGGFPPRPCLPAGRFAVKRTNA